MLFSCSEDQNEISNEDLSLEINEESVTADAITISWNSVKGAVYNVSIAGEEMEANFSMEDNETFSFKNLNSESFYNISVTAVNVKNKNTTLGQSSLKVLTKSKVDLLEEKIDNDEVYSPLISNKTEPTS